jgi:hypothetical protein
VPLRKRLEGPGGIRTVGAVEIEAATDPEMSARLAALADTEAVEHLDLESGKEMRHPVARHEHRARLPVPHLRRGCQTVLACAQVACVGLVLEEPGRFITARCSRCRDRPQDRIGIELRGEEQVSTHAGAS